MNKNLKLIQEIGKNLLSKIGYEGVDIDVQEGDDENINLKINISEEESGLLIGFHGENIFALQLIINQINFKKIGEWKRVIVNVGNYREKRKDAMDVLAQNAASKVVATGKPVALPYLNSNERRMIHMILSENEEVETFSEGEGKSRRLVIQLKQ